ELDMDDRIIAKNVFDCMGHYTRWDLVSLNIREEGWEPVRKIESSSEYPKISLEKIEQVARKFKLSQQKLERILEELEII
ncbi:MAG: hypothetical protein ACUVWV_14125, partial [Thermodesulfobacteriota bacterium]